MQISAEVYDAVQYIVDTVSCSATCESSFPMMTPLPSMANPLLFRNNDMEEEDEGDFCLPRYASDDDSDAEFNRILEYTANQRRLAFKEDFGEAPCKKVKEDAETAAKRNQDNIEIEYANLPPIENLAIHVEDPQSLKYMGEVQSIVDCLVVVKSEIPIALDWDTVLFSESGRSIGKVFDIIGQVYDPLYSIRFNTSSEARAFAVGTRVFYVPLNQEYTRTVLVDQVKNERHVDTSCENGEDDTLLFSDDEEERMFYMKKKNPGEEGTQRGRGGKKRNRGRGGQNGPTTQWPPRGRSGSSHPRGGQQWRQAAPYRGAPPPYFSNGPQFPFVDTRYMGGDGYFP